MDVRDIFRKLTTNKYIPDFDYKNYKLSFQTVFYTCNYKYCCCPCAFDHEWLTYISDEPQIDEELYTKVEANLLAGKCPHVDDVISDYVRETTVYGIHIAAAAGTEKAIKRVLTVGDGGMLSSIFKLTPYTVAILKNNIKTTALLFKDLSYQPQLQKSLPRALNVVYPKHSGKNDNVIELREESLLEFCVRTANKELLKAVLMPALFCERRYKKQLVAALNMALKCNSTVCINTMIKIGKKMPRQSSSSTHIIDEIDWDHTIDEIGSIIYRLVIFDKPDILEKVLKAFMKDDHEREFNATVVELCATQAQGRCYKLLHKYELLPREPCDLRQRLPYLLDLFDDFPDIMTYELETIPDLSTVFKSILPRHCVIPYYLRLLGCFYLAGLFGRKSRIRYLTEQPNIVETACRPVLKWILSQDNLIDMTLYEQNETLLTFFLTHLTHRVGHESKFYFRANLEMFLYMNSNSEVNALAVEYCLELDENLFSKWVGEDLIMFPQRLITDAKEHSVFGQNDGSDYGLEFTAPLLLECGYSATRETLEAALDKNLHPDELKYIRAYIDTPRSLKLRCRDALKKHFKGMGLHHFVEMSAIPQNIKDFILLKTVLNYV